jgi:cytochrome P450
VSCLRLYNGPAGRASGLWQRAKLPPGPHLPSALQAIGWSQRPLPFLERCQKQYGDIFTLRIRHAGTWVVLCDAQDIKQIFTTSPQLLGAGVANTLLGPLLGKRSVMLLEEPEHQTRRRIMLPSFHGASIERYRELIASVARGQIRTWPVGEPLELWPRMQAITLEVIMRVVFGGIESPQLQRLREHLNELTQWLNDPSRLRLLALLGPRWLAGNADFRSVLAPVEQAVLEEVHWRHAAGAAGMGDDVVSMLGRARYEDGTALSEQDLRDELITLLSDGPTATLLSWAFERLLRHPDKLARLRAEVLAGDSEEYLDAVMKETMRLCPAVPIVVRRLEEPMRLSGYVLPAGTRVAPCIHLMHRRADIYPQPLRFMPERFLQGTPGMYTWIPFGGGARRCLAASFAQLEMKRVMHTVLSEVELASATARSEGMTRSSIAFAPDGHARAMVLRRMHDTPDGPEEPMLSRAA